MNSDIIAALEKAALVYPHPIAVACGRVLTSRSITEQLDAILRAGEALTRYAAALTLASFSARTDPARPAPGSLGQFTGPLSWHNFLSVCQQVALLPDGLHPLELHLGAGFRVGKNGEAPADVALTALRDLRNAHGHELQSLSKARAEVIFAQHQPDQLLVKALNALQGLLSLPLFLVEDQRLTRGRILARRLLLMGESDNPRPDEIELSGGLDETNVLYLGVPNGTLKLWPWLTWGLAERRVTYAVFVIHAIGPMVKYKSMFGDDLEQNGALLDSVNTHRLAAAHTVEPVGIADGLGFMQEWNNEKRTLEQMMAQRGGPIPWNQLDPHTLLWYAQRLDAKATGSTAPKLIRNQLLDGRDILRPDELKQVCLLFGNDKLIRQTLERDLLDCRARKNDQPRWDERLLLRRNVIESLRIAVDFFSRHIGVAGATLDGLEATTGSADYIAMREALVNLFVHQDYDDNRTTAQIEIAPERTTFFNAGQSLVTVAGLVEGGKSQARNPLIARALRLLGFAELAGSGLRALQMGWRQAGRRPPRFESDAAANSFTLTLDWRPVPVVVDALWHSRLGVKVSPQQARILALLADPAGFTEPEIASGTGLLLEDVKADTRYLKLQNLIQEHSGRYSLRDDLYAVFNH